MATRATLSAPPRPGEGVGIFDAKTGKALSVAWVLTGTYHAGPASERPRPTAAVIEWSAKP